MGLEDRELVDDSGTRTTTTTGGSIGGATPPKFSTEAKESFNAVAGWATELWDVTKSEVTGRINKVALDFYHANNQRWPGATELFQYGNFQRAMSTYVNGYYQLPPFFQVGADLYVNHELWGPEKVDRQHPAFADTAAAQDLGGVLGGTSSELLGGRHLITGVGGEALAGNQDLFAGVPFIPDVATLNDILIGLRPRGGGGGGGGGGAAARADLVFDEAQLQEQARSIWRPLMLEEPPDVEGLVSGYLKEATSFWRKDGGRLDFQTYVTNQARKEGRYKNLYRRKKDFQSEAEYMGGFRQTAAGFGLSAGETLKQTEAGATSGASLTGFSDRLERIRENQINQQGTFSQRFANNINQLGAIGRS